MPTGSSAFTDEQVTTSMTLDVPNELEYVMVAVPKPAGHEPLNQLRSWDARTVRVDDKELDKKI